ncbi:DNA polymerase III subunit delta [Spirochaetia bacterium]|nr:DNA polymerase III subunit delta [Spirochaetia bacterium]
MAPGKTGISGQCYLFLGPELGEKKDALEGLRKSLGRETGDPPAQSSLEETSFYAGETAVSEMVSVIRNGSLFSASRLFLIKNAEVLKKKEECELLVSCIGSPQEDAVLVLISDETKLDSRLENAVPKENKRIFWELFENRKTEWVAAFFRREGYTISDEGISTVLEMVENNTDALRRECSRLMFFLGKDRVIGEEEVEKCLSHTREESAFTLFSGIAQGNLTRSVGILHTLLGAKESSQAILAGLAWCFRKLRDYLFLTVSGNLNDFEFKKIGLGSPKVRADYIQAARRFASADGALALIGEYELLLRSSGSGPEILLMDLLIYKLAYSPPLAASSPLRSVFGSAG